MENLGIFYDYFVYFTAIVNILWSFGIFVVIWYICGHLVYLSPFWYFVPRKIWQPWLTFIRCTLMVLVCEAGVPFFMLPLH
jgi:hypothetical protein